MKKKGANYTDQNDIRYLAGEGFDASAISTRLGIVLSCVQSFMPPAELTPQQRGAVTRKANAEQAVQDAADDEAMKVLDDEEAA